MHKILLCLTSLILLPGADSSAEIIRTEANALGNLTMLAATLNYLIAFSGFVFHCIRMNLVGGETVKPKEQLILMHTGLLKGNEFKTGSFKDEQKIINSENEKMKIEVLLKYYFIFEINKTCTVLKPYCLHCLN